jgi:hypothetical protein
VRALIRVYGQMASALFQQIQKCSSHTTCTKHHHVTWESRIHGNFRQSHLQLSHQQEAYSNGRKHFWSQSRFTQRQDNISCNPHVAGHITPVPHDILATHCNIHLAVTIMYINKLPFLITYSQSLHFATVEFLDNRQTATICKKLQSVFNLYHHRGITITKLFTDPEFEALHPWFPCLDTCRANDHIPDIECFIRTVKDRSRSTYRMLPFNYIPWIVLIQLVKNVIFWLNSFPV